MVHQNHRDTNTEIKVGSSPLGVFLATATVLKSHLLLLIVDQPHRSIMACESVMSVQQCVHRQLPQHFMPTVRTSLGWCQSRLNGSLPCERNSSNHLQSTLISGGEIVSLFIMFGFKHSSALLTMCLFHSCVPTFFQLH